MNVSAERTISHWARTARVADAPALQQDARADVVVVGAGIAGLSTAYELVRAKRQVIVVDRGPLAGGMSARTSAHLSSELDDYYYELISLRGLEQARLYYQSQAAALDRIEAVAASESIACDFARITATSSPETETIQQY